MNIIHLFEVVGRLREGEGVVEVTERGHEHDGWAVFLALLREIIDLIEEVVGVVAGTHLALLDIRILLVNDWAEEDDGAWLDLFDGSDDVIERLILFNLVVLFVLSLNVLLLVLLVLLAELNLIIDEVWAVEDEARERSALRLSRGGWGLLTDIVQDFLNTDHTVIIVAEEEDELASEERDL